MHALSVSSPRLRRLAFISHLLHQSTNRLTSSATLSTMVHSPEAQSRSAIAYPRNRTIQPSLSQSTLAASTKRSDVSEPKNLGRMTPESHRLGRRKVRILSTETISTKDTGRESTGSTPQLNYNSDHAESREPQSNRTGRQPQEREQAKEEQPFFPIASPYEPKKTENNALSWKSDPSTSFSDWTIEVIVKQSDQQAASTLPYHCHSNVLAWGPRQSGCFVKLFQERMAKMPPSKTSRIYLKQGEAMVFPMLLDFMYCETSLPLSADRACGLYCLADRFEMPQLMNAIQSFVEKGLNFTRIIEFLSFARRHENKEKVEKLVLFANSKLCGYLVKHPEDAGQVPPDLLAHILHSRAQCIKVLKGENPRNHSGDWELKRSRLLSKVVATCCHEAIHSDSSKQKLSRQVFERLINPKHLPAMDSDAALKLLQVDAAIAREDDTGTHIEGDPGDSTAAITKAVKKLTYFEERCLQALVATWTTTMNGKDNDLVESLQRVAPHILSELLVMVSRQYEGKLAQNKRMTNRNHQILDPSFPRKVPPRRSDETKKNPPYYECLQPSTTQGVECCTQLEDMIHLYGEEYDEDDDFTNTSLVQRSTYASTRR